jgi:hypothetical protein
MSEMAIYRQRAGDGNGMQSRITFFTELFRSLMSLFPRDGNCLSMGRFAKLLT